MSNCPELNTNCTDCTENCQDINYTDVNCDEIYPFKCMYWSGNAITCLNINNGDTGDVVITKLTSAVCNYMNNQVDEKFKISSSDNSSGYFNDKIIAGNGITFTTSTDGSGNKSISISANSQVPSLVITSSNNTISSSVNGLNIGLGVVVSSDSNNVLSIRSNGLYVSNPALVKISSTDTTADYLLNKLVAGGNVSLTKLNTGGDEQILISTSFSGLTTVSSSNTNSVTISGTGTSVNPLSSDVNISSVANNLISKNSDGLVVLPYETYRVKTTSSDSSPDYLSTKLIAGTGISITLNTNGSGIQTLTFASTLSSGYTSTLDSNNITFSGSSSSVITASVKIDSASNLLTSSSNGLRVIPQSIESLTDVNVSSPSNGQVLTWNSSSSKWIATSVSSPLTFSNGLTNTSNSVKLGGSITGDTTLTCGSYHFNIDGSVYATGYFYDQQTISDKTLKNFIKAERPKLIENLNIHSFKWKDKSDDLMHWSWTAQQVQKFFPDAVVEVNGKLRIHKIEVLTVMIDELVDEIKGLKKTISILVDNKK